MKQYHVISSVFESDKEAKNIVDELNKSPKIGKNTTFMLMTVETPD